MFNFRAIGVSLNTVKNVTYDGNVLIHVAMRTTFGGKDMDKWAGVATCTLP